MIKFDLCRQISVERSNKVIDENIYEKAVSILRDEYRKNNELISFDSVTELFKIPKGTAPELLLKRIFGNPHYFTGTAYAFSLEALNIIFRAEREREENTEFYQNIKNMGYHDKLSVIDTFNYIDIEMGDVYGPAWYEKRKEDHIKIRRFNVDFPRDPYVMLLAIFFMEMIDNTYLNGIFHADPIIREISKLDEYEWELEKFKRIIAPKLDISERDMETVIESIKTIRQDAYNRGIKDSHKED